MKGKELQDRTKRLALRIIILAGKLPNKPEGWVISKQIIKSATSTAANYRATCRARSDNEFLAKLYIVLEESDETLFWLEIIEEAQLIPGESNELKALKTETNELISIIVASIKTLKNKNPNSKI